MLHYLADLAATVVFAMTGALAVGHRDVDIFGVIVFGVLTAVGGGTLRDIILDVPVFWLADFSFVWVAVGASIVIFIVRPQISMQFRLLLYLDALGCALFVTEGMYKGFSLGYIAPICVIVGMLTALGGGVIRDALSGRPSLLMSQQLYASPLLMGALSYWILMKLIPSILIATSTSVLLIFVLRALIIYFNISAPHWLIKRASDKIE